MSKTTYYNLYHQEEMTWDPETGGTYFYCLRPGDDGRLDNGNRFYGNPSPQTSRRRAIADAAIAIARFPELSGRIQVVHAPCLFSDRESWIVVGSDADVPADMMAEAQQVAGHSFSSMAFDGYRSRHGIGSTYM